MSLHEKFREEIYGSPAEKEELQGYADQAAQLLDSNAHSHVLGRRLLFAIIANLLIVLLAIFKPSLLIEVLAEYLLLIPFIAFALGFFIAFAACRMYQQTFDRAEAQTGVDRGVMSGYTGYEQRSKYQAVWFVGAIGAILNLLLIITLAWFF